MARKSMRVAAALGAMAAVALVDGRAATDQARRQQYACYPGQFTAFRARRVTITDSVAKLTAIVRLPREVCAPAVIDRAKSAEGTPYLTCYEISTSAAVRRNLGDVSNTLGRARVTVGSPRTLCLSSSRTSRPPARVRLTCYAVIRPASDTQIRKTVGDTFGTSSDSVHLGRPVSFCTESATAPLQLMCYSIDSTTLGRALVVTDEWSILRASLGRRDRLCIQSSVRR